jgi:hypothetical protein
MESIRGIGIDVVGKKWLKNSVLNIKYKNKQDRQYTCNVTFRRVRVTTVTVEKGSTVNILSVCGLSGCTIYFFFTYYHLNPTILLWERGGGSY